MDPRNITFNKRETLLIFQGIAMLEYNNYKKLTLFETFPEDRKISVLESQCIELKKIDICAELLNLKSLNEKVSMSSIHFGIASLNIRDIELIIKLLDFVSDDYKFRLKKRMLTEFFSMRSAKSIH